MYCIRALAFTKFLLDVGIVQNIFLCNSTYSYEEGRGGISIQVQILVSESPIKADVFDATV